MATSFATTVKLDMFPIPYKRSFAVLKTSLALQRGRYFVIDKDDK